LPFSPRGFKIAVMSRTSVLIGLLSAITSISAITLAPTSARALVFAGDLPIWLVEDIEIADGLAYVVSRSDVGPVGPTLRILDLSDPSTPVEVGSLDTPIGAQDVEVVGGLAYITDRDIAGSMRIIDVSNPTAPVEIGAFASQFAAIDVEVVGNFAYLADQLFVPRGNCCGSAFRVIDVSNPAAPFQVSERFLPLMGDMEASEGVVYTAGWDLEALDVSNPATPALVGVEPGTYSDDIALVEGRVYTTAGLPKFDPSTGEQYGLEIIDVADPTNPWRVGRGSATGSSIAVVDGHAYTSGFGLDVADVSNPAAPIGRGSIYSEFSKAVAVYGGYAYLAIEDRLRIVDLSVPDTPALLGSAVVDEPSGRGLANDVAVADGFAYLGVGDSRQRLSPNGLRTFDVTDPSAPVALGAIHTVDAAMDVELEGGLAYVAAGVDGLRIFDVTTPSAPTAAGGLALPGSSAKLELVGGIAYVVDRGIRSAAPVALRVVDVSDPLTPVELGVVELADSTRACRTPGISVAQEVAYVTCGLFFAIDISDPAQPALISSNPFPGFESSIDVEEDLAYIGSYSDSLAVFDVSDPALPVQVSWAPGGGRAILVENGSVYNASGTGLAVHHIADPLQPVLMGGFPNRGGDWRGLTVADGLVFGAVGAAGLQIVDLGPEYARALAVEIAIRSDGESGAVNLASRGVIPVTVFGAADFDVAEIDRSTLRFGPAPAAPAHKSGGHLEDTNGDGRLDLVSHYWIGDSGISVADERACVTGQTFAGTPFEGCGALGVTLPRSGADASLLAN
jgi:hypothetical protein